MEKLSLPAALLVAVLSVADNVINRNTEIDERLSIVEEQLASILIKIEQLTVKNNAN